MGQFDLHYFGFDFSQWEMCTLLACLMAAWFLSQAIEKRMRGSEVGPRVVVSRHFLVACWLMFPPEMRGRGNGNSA